MQLHTHEKALLQLQHGATLSTVGPCHREASPDLRQWALTGYAHELLMLTISVSVIMSKVFLGDTGI